MLQYITNTECQRSVVDQIAGVLEGGCRWIQIRMKDASDDEIRQVVRDVKPMCAKYDAFLLLNDRVELTKELELTGVHLGKEDMPVSQARSILGPAAVVGATVNTYEDILRLRALDIDYFGIGPYSMTSTKKNLAPVLGLDGVANLCGRMREDEIEIATVAVGGITLSDVNKLMQAGVQGVAVSGAIANAADLVQTTREFIRD